MFLLNSRLGPFTAPSNGFLRHHQKDPFSLSYGAKLPSSLTWVHSRALVSSTILPVSVLVRLPIRFTRSFSWQHGLSRSPSPREFGVPSPFRVVSQRTYLPGPPTGLDHHIQTMAGLASCVTPSLKHRTSSPGILNLMPITYALWPRLRGRLTLGGRTFPRKPQDSGGRDSHPAFRYSCPHNHFHAIHVRLPSRFASAWNAPLPIRDFKFEISNPAASAAGLVPIIFGAESLD